MKRMVPAPIASRLSSAVWRQVKPTWRFPSGLVVEVLSVAEWVVYNDIFVEGEYDVAIERVIEVDAAPFVIDIGANVGYFSLRFADKWLRQKADSRFTIVGFEGSPNTYSELQRRMNQPALNGAVAFHSGLVGRRTGNGHISKTAFHVSNAMVSKSSFGSSTVPFVDIESVIPPQRQISLMKCDIEGAEQMFLENYPELLKRVNLAVFEFHAEKCDVARCIELLANAGLKQSLNVRKCGSISVDVFQRI